jgi:hypothetical protein
MEVNMWCAREVNDVVQFFQHDDPIPEGAVRDGAAYWMDKVLNGFNIEYLIINDGAVVEMTEEEKAIVDAYNAQIAAEILANKVAQDALDEQNRIANEALEQARQAELEAFYNQYLDYCYAVTGNRVKAGFDELTTALTTLKATDPLSALELSSIGLNLNAKGQFLIGLNWYDRCPNE